MNRQERLSELSPTRRALLGAGIATIAFSLILSIAPALGKNANAGTVKIHDVSSGQTYDDKANDPTVCAFTVIFDFSDPVQQGTWEILVQDSGWIATGKAGTYDTTLDGTYETDLVTLAAGHYKFEYQPAGTANGSKSKVFTVGESCDAADPADTSTASPTPSIVADPADTSTASPTPSIVADPADTSTASPTPSIVADPTDTSTASPTPSIVADPTASATTSATEGAVAGVTGSSEPSASPAEGTTISDGTTDQLPNTSIGDTITLTSLLTALGLLMIIAAHPFIRRSAHADRA